MIRWRFDGGCADAEGGGEEEEEEKRKFPGYPYGLPVIFQKICSSTRARNRGLR
jgi:hypothetical protein